MKFRLLALSLIAAWVLGGCTAPEPFDDVSQAAPAARPALQACLAAPDLQGNQWPARSGKARCWLSLPQDPSLDEIAATLAKPDGAALLDRQYAQILDKHYKDPAHRDFLFIAYQDFQTAKGGKLAATWYSKSPKSPYAQLAMGEATLSQAWDARGNAFADKTSDAQVGDMEAQLRRAAPLLQSALQAEPRLSPACAALMQIGSMISDESLRLPATRQCMKVDPLSVNVESQWLSDIDPRWGGSFDMLDAAIAKSVAPKVKDSPLLGALLAKGIGRRAYLGFDSDDLSAIKPALERAVRTAPDAFYLEKASEAEEQAGDRDKALDDVNQALRFLPDDADFLIQRGLLRAHMSRTAAALNDAKHAAKRMDGGCDCGNYDQLALLFEALYDMPDERLALQKAIKSETDHTWALSTLCRSYISPAFESVPAQACTKQYVEESPDDSDALLQRAVVLYVAHDPAAAEFDARFRKKANPKDPDDVQAMGQLDALREHPDAPPSPR